VVFAILGLLGTDLTALIDAAVIAGLTFGVYKKNRGCAIAMFVVWVIEKLTQWMFDPVALFGLPIAILFGYYFFEGILGTFEYHRIATNSRKNQKEIDRTSVEEAITEQRLRKQEENRNSSIGW
jgi:serine/threonine-protein kinase